jgi:hypothetical protein
MRAPLVHGSNKSSDPHQCIGHLWQNVMTLDSRDSSGCFATCSWLVD